MKRASILIEGEDIRKLAEILLKQLEEPHAYEAGNMIILMKEKYYYRIRSNLLSIYILNFIDDNKVDIELVTGGGEDKLESSWGAENSENYKNARSLMTICDEHSWKITEIRPEKFKKSIETCKGEKIIKSISKFFKN